MKKVLKGAGILLTLVAVLAVLMTSVAMAKNLEPGNAECPGICNQTQTQTKDCLQSQDCICTGDQLQTQACTQSQDCTCTGDQTQTQAGEPSQSLTQTQTQTENAGENNQIGEPSQSQTQKQAKTKTKTGLV